MAGQVCAMAPTGRRHAPWSDADPQKTKPAEAGFCRGARNYFFASSFLASALTSAFCCLASAAATALVLLTSAALVLASALAEAAALSAFFWAAAAFLAALASALAFFLSAVAVALAVLASALASAFTSALVVGAEAAFIGAPVWEAAKDEAANSVAARTARSLDMRVSVKWIGFQPPGWACRSTTRSPVRRLTSCPHTRATLRADMAAASTRRPFTIALAGLVALGVAMGIGRFAFTPLLPMMLAERSVDLRGASLLASANYLGYLVGALACTFQPWIWRRLGISKAVNGPKLVRFGLGATTLLTLGMAMHLPGAWTLLRFAAGVASALVFLYTSGFCLEQLARRGVPGMGALIYVGPGMGIVASGLAATALVQMEAPAASGWLTFGVLAALRTAAVWRVFDANHAIAAPASGRTATGQAPLH